MRALFDGFAALFRGGKFGPKIEVPPAAINPASAEPVQSRRYRIWESGGINGSTYRLEIDGGTIEVSHPEGFSPSSDEEAIALACVIVEKRHGIEAVERGEFVVEWDGSL